MTREQIQALTDAELVMAAAEKVMGWAWRMYTLGHRAVMEDGGQPDIPSAPSLTVPIKKNGNTWRPLDSWDDTMQVVDAMRAKGWSFELSVDGDETDARFRKVVLEAALIAMEESK